MVINMARIQKDHIKSVPSHVIVFPTWKSPEKYRGKRFYPNGMLMLDCSSFESSFFIARYKSGDGSWNFRSSTSDQEKFEEPSLQFLIADKDDVSWEPVIKNRLPQDKLTVFPEDEEKSNVWIGKHISFGVGVVSIIDDILTYTNGENHFTDNYEVLCNKK